MMAMRVQRSFAEPPVTVSVVAVSNIGNGSRTAQRFHNRFDRLRRAGCAAVATCPVFRDFPTIDTDDRASPRTQPGPMHTSSIHQGNVVLKAQGVELRWPGFWAFTSASIMAIGLWLLLCGIAVRVDPGLNRADFASLLAVMWLSVAFTRMGLDPRSSRAAAAVQFVVCAVAVLLLQALF